MRLSAENVQWQDWPEGAVRAEYITSAGTPNAIDQMKGSVARFELFPGEPIQQNKLVRSDQGYLSAVLDKGMRGVSISVAAESASGGFIVPNDHVDVILTQGGPNGQQTSSTLLSNVRVLAINARLGETGKTGGSEDSSDPNASPKSQVFPGTAIATLELDPPQAETIITCAAFLPFTTTVGFAREPSGYWMASRWISSTTLMVGYFLRFFSMTVSARS